MQVGQKIGPFIVDKELGSGAMGAVFRGRHGESGKKVAIKIIATGLANNTSALARFKRETSILKQLDHPHIVKLLASGKVEGTPFYVMEYVEGESLDHIMNRRGRITWEELVTLGQQLCAALQHAHELGIVHRDLKPANLMILKDGTVKLTDFGIAKDIDVTALTAANSTVGTAAYMSPEQCRGSLDITNKSDLYSMGVMFFELLTGRKPFLADTVMQMFMEHTQGKFPRPSKLCMDIPVWLDTIICDLLEKQPDKRPFNAEAVSMQLGLVKQKWEAQQSAAMARVKKRRTDRSGTDVPLDETEKELGRTMLGKKKKVKTQPFYQKAWFTLASVSTVLAALAAIIYFVFFMAPSAESLYVLAELAMKSPDANERWEARHHGPLEEFLRYYPQHVKAGQIQRWVDQVDEEDCEKSMYKRRNSKIAVDGDAESIARLSLDAEEEGRLDEAKKHWDNLLKYKKSDDAKLRPWGLVADKFLGEYKEVDNLYRDAQDKIAEESRSKLLADGITEAEKIALKAVRRESENKWDEAKSHWEALQSHAKLQENRRIWLLLANKRLRELPKS